MTSHRVLVCTEKAFPGDGLSFGGVGVTDAVIDLRRASKTK